MRQATVSSEENRKEEVAKNLKIAYDFFKENGAGTYGDGTRDIIEQFASHYTMGYEMGIWCDSNFHLNQLALKVTTYEITVSEYISTVFINLFTYYKSNYHHFLYQILNKAKEEGVLNSEINKEIISKTLPVISKLSEQVNLIFNYLIASDLFVKVKDDTMMLSDKWINKAEELINCCNLEYEKLPFNEAIKKFKNKNVYADYVTKSFSINKSNECDLTNDNSSERQKNASNILLYGVPGSGKSHTIENEYCNDFDLMERVVFHPDYMNTDFVGQILPTVKGVGDQKEITYEFTAGPFTRILKKAVDNPGKHYFLIIEEINRGNAPAIFGEIFQLLDRKHDGSSSYKITNHNIASIVFKDANVPIYIPSNLSLLATMNTADQNVFTLDTAFQRRWDMRMIENNVSKSNIAQTTILDTKVSWAKFNSVINNHIISNDSSILSSEDKRLGAYFVTEEVLSQKIVENKSSKFGDKVIKYLWDDVFKFGRDDLFAPKYRTLEEVLSDFNSSTGTNRFNIFKQDIIDNLYSASEDVINE